MLFNSYPFPFGFLPVVLAGFYILGARRRTWALLWLTAASLFFYAWWRPINVLLIAPSILINYGLARGLERTRDVQPARAKALLIAGILFNLCFLGYFKYLNFFESSLGDAFGAGFVLTRLILPLGISFITFQKIAFLVDVHGSRVDRFSLAGYNRRMAPFGFVLTFVSVVAAMVLFQAPTVSAALLLWKGMVGAYGITSRRPSSPASAAPLSFWLPSASAPAGPAGPC